MRVLYEFYINCVIYELTDAYFVWCCMSHCELFTSSSLVSYVYTLCPSYQCYSRIPVKEYYLAPSAGLEHHYCPSPHWLNQRSKSQSLSLITRILCLRTWQIVIHYIAWCYSVILVTHTFFELNRYSSGHGVHISLFVLFSVLLRGVLTLLRYMLT